MSSGKTAGSRVPSTSSVTAASSPAQSALVSSSSGVHGLHRPSGTSSGAGAGAGAASLNSGTFSPLAPLLSLIPRSLIPSQTQLDLLILSTVLKLLLFPSYHSTDFEVHRNWLAITHSVPLRGWYFDHGSEWTLDYPPFFAYFSYVLGVPNAWFGCGDARITKVVEGLGLANESTKTYMRASVVLTELVLGAALVAHSRAPRLGRLSPGHLEKQINEHHVRAATRPSGGGGGSDSATHLPPSIRLLGRKTTRFFGGALDFDEATATLLAASVFFHPGLIIIDHIHFQYNGFLFGVLLWAIWAARERRLLLCAVLFSSLLNLKHIYVYIAPAFTVFLLRTYVIPPGAESKLRTHPDIFFLAIERLLGLALVTLIPFAFSLGPLVWDTLANGGGVGEHGVGAVLGQVLARLFPFSRGLNHAYWAPNAWALWTFTDRIALKLLRARPSLGQFVPQYFSRNIGNASAVESASRGLVGDTTFAVLPDITPGVCFGLTLLAMGPFLAYLWVRPSYRRFLAALTGCGFASFLFGWHVHEKAILLVLIPFTPLAVQSYTHFRIWTIVSGAGIVSLFPLLFEVRETPIKIGYSLLWAIVVGGQLKRKVYRPVPSNLGLVIHFLEDLYLLGLVPLQIYVDVLHPMLFSGSTSSTSSSIVGGVAAAAAPVVSAAVSMAQPLITPLQSAAENVVGHAAGSITAAAAAAVAAAVPTGILAANTSLAQATAAAAGTSSATDTPVVIEASLEFLPLMLTSVYCALGVCWAWARLGWACWHNEGEDLGAVGGVEGGEKNVVLEGSHGEEEAAEAEYRLSQQQGAEGGDGMGMNGGGGAAGRYSGLPVLGGDIVNSPGLPLPGYGHGHGLGHIHGLPAFGGHMIPPRIRAPISDDARSSGSVRVRRGRLQGAESPLQQQQQQQQLHGGDALPMPMPMPVRKRKVTGTGAGASAVAASAAATAGARME
ncbi:unnamed protein product [Tilletia caries]|nr:unnamed protein product [Tilletia caries]